MESSENNLNGGGKPKSMAGVATHDHVIKLVESYLAKPGRVVDLAAGEGAFSLRIKELGHMVVAVDGFDKSWKVPEIDLQVVNLDSEFAVKIVSGDNKFDAVVAIEIIEHLENPFQFVRECAKLLKPGGLLFLTSPNVETVHSRLIFLYTGRLNSFGAYETVRPAHITPIFRWKLDMMLDEARLEMIHQEFEKPYLVPGSNLKIRLSQKIARVISPFVKGDKGGMGRIIVARLNELN